MRIVRAETWAAPPKAPENAGGGVAASCGPVAAQTSPMQTLSTSM